MKTAGLFFAIFVCVVAIAGCETVPSEMRLTSAKQRRVNDEPGTNLTSMRLACAQRMLSLSPATAASGIDAHVVSQADIVVIEVDALLMHVGEYGRNIQSTYRCEYKNGSFVGASFTRGLTTTPK